MTTTWIDPRIKTHAPPKSYYRTEVCAGGSGFAPAACCSQGTCAVDCIWGSLSPKGSISGSQPGRLALGGEAI